jgi:6-phosphogluconate dehydrogenase
MQIGYIGLGKMGFGMAERMLEHGHKVVACNRSPDPIKKITEKGAEPAQSYEELVKKLDAPKFIWIMVSHKAVDEVLDNLVHLLQEGDTIIDGGNSPYKDSMRRHKELKQKNINFLDVGVSGGPDGARNGACLMIGGDKTNYDKFETLWNDLSAPDGFGYMGRGGAGHFVKMIHNGIEYGMMQAIAEGFTIMKKSDFALDLTQIADVYNHQSVVTSRLVGWLKTAFEQNGEDLNSISGTARQSGEGKWTMETAQELNIPTPIINGSVNFRLESENNPSYTGQIISALRNQFGRHNVSKE